MTCAGRRSACSISRAAWRCSPRTPSVKTQALYRRHALPVRVMHWINVVALSLMFMSGLQIFNAHPALYWGESSYSGRPAWLEIGVNEGPQANVTGYTRLLGHEF